MSWAPLSSLISLVWLHPQAFSSAPWKFQAYSSWKRQLWASQPHTNKLHKEIWGSRIPRQSLWVHSDQSDLTWARSPLTAEAGWISTPTTRPLTEGLEVPQGARRKGGRKHNEVCSLQNFSFSLVAKVCPTFDSMDCNLPGSSVHGILQARTLEWIAITFSRRPFQPRDQTRFSCTAGRFFTDWATREAHRMFALR